MVPTSGERLEMVKLESVGFGTLPTVRVDVAAAVAVPREDGAPDRRGDVMSALARVRRPGLFAARLAVGARLTGAL